MTPTRQALITDRFERSVIFDRGVEVAAVEETADGRYRVSMTVRASKFEADGEGRETEQPLDMLVDVGLFALSPADKDFDETAVIQLDKQPIRGGRTTLEFVVDRPPAQVGIDPYNKLIDRNSDDNLKKIGL